MYITNKLMGRLYKSNGWSIKFVETHEPNIKNFFFSLNKKVGSY